MICRSAHVAFTQTSLRDITTYTAVFIPSMCLCMYVSWTITNENYTKKRIMRTGGAKDDLDGVWQRSITDAGERWHLELIHVVRTQVDDCLLSLTSVDCNWPPGCRRRRQPALVDAVALRTITTAQSINRSIKKKLNLRRRSELKITAATTNNY